MRLAARQTSRGLSYPHSSRQHPFPIKPAWVGSVLCPPPPTPRQQRHPEDESQPLVPPSADFLGTPRRGRNCRLSNSAILSTWVVCCLPRAPKFGTSWAGHNVKSGHKTQPPAAQKRRAHGATAQYIVLAPWLMLDSATSTFHHLLYSTFLCILVQ